MKQVRNLLSVDIYRLIDDGCKPLAELLADPVTFVDVLYVLCKEEADKRGVTDEQFGRALGGDSLEAAIDCFVESLKLFIPNPRVREGLGRVLAKSKAVQELLSSQAERDLEKLDPQKVANEIAQQASTKRNGSSGASRASSDSTPDRTPSAS